MLIAVLGAGGGSSALTSYLGFGSGALAEEALVKANEKQDSEIFTLREAYSQCNSTQKELQITMNKIAVDVATLLERTKNQ